MPKFILQFEDRVLDEYVIGPQGVTIGRLPNNHIVIDNPAISGHHARVIRDGLHCVLEDLESTNGTFVNEKVVTRHELHSGDVVLVGKHTLLFDGRATEEPVEETSPETVPELGGTMVLETKQHREMLAKIDAEAQAKKGAAAGAAPVVAPPPPRIGMLRVLSGRSDRAEYTLDAHTSIIGKSDTALVRLKGWFKPKAALALARKGESYTATPMGGKVSVNGETLNGRRDLKEGDVIAVSGLMLHFHLKG